MRTENARQRIRFWGGVFWCSKRAARQAAGALCRICAVFVSVIRSTHTPVKAHGNYISTRILALAPLMALYRQNSGVMMSLSHVTIIRLSCDFQSFLTYVEIMSYRLRLKMTTPFRQKYGHNERPHAISFITGLCTRYAYVSSEGV